MPSLTQWYQQVSKHSPAKRTLEVREAEVPDAIFSFSPSSDFFHKEAFKINCYLYCASQCPRLKFVTCVTEAGSPQTRQNNVLGLFVFLQLNAPKINETLTGLPSFCVMKKRQRLHGCFKINNVFSSVLKTPLMKSKQKKKLCVFCY